MAAGWLKTLTNSTNAYSGGTQSLYTRLRRSGKSISEISEVIGEEIEVTVSRQEDVTRQINELNASLKQAVADRQELTFRIQTLDENRQFLFKQATELECSIQELEQKEEESKAELKKMEEKKERDEKSIRKVEQSLKGVSELRESMKEKIPKMEDTYNQLVQSLADLKREHDKLSEEIAVLMAQKSEAKAKLLSHAAAAAAAATMTTTSPLTSHPLVTQSKTISTSMSPNPNPSDDLNSNHTSAEQPITVDHDQVPASTTSTSTITDTVTARMISESKHDTNNKNDNNNDNNDEQQQQQWHIWIDKLDKEMEQKNALLGKLLLDQAAKEKEVSYLRDTLQLHRQTRDSLEESQHAWLEQRDRTTEELSSITVQSNELVRTLAALDADKAKRRHEFAEIQAALVNLSAKKTQFINTIKLFMEHEKETNEHVKVLHRNNLNLKARQLQLAQDLERLQLEKEKELEREKEKQMALLEEQKAKEQQGEHKIEEDTHQKKEEEEEEDHSHDMTCTVVRRDNLLDGCGLLALSSTRLTFSPVATNGQSENEMRSNAVEMNVASEIVVTEYMDTTGKKQNKSSEKHATHILKIITRKDVVYLFEAVDDRDNEQLFAISERLKMIRGCNVSISISLTLEQSDILEIVKLKEIMRRCPARTKLWNWKKCYSTELHGISMITFYDRCAHADESILLLKDTNHCIFGAFVDAPWISSDEYRGSIDCFVWKFDQEGGLCVYKPSGSHPYYVRSDMSSITIGGGECPALYLDSNLNFGRTDKCPTFDSPPLTTDNFAVLCLEIYGVE
ncbi:oxidation resistance 1-like protein [Reticulomyxa filosa]|uniref:Oxidation resistance 1-like protein n=1 Tax=Reticulomyxa filosa TaxID=46433 RepID=X6MZX8_RETFI|nr:oxidation resistance 1-like protein [Reticulomyxa filosa]|eukprot:ETO19356.1 oxidation resistance 1-like protein [Reticulomyxa filosa]